MSLLAWYPLISNGNNQGLDGINLETIGSVTYTTGKLGNAATFSANLSNYLRRPQIKLYDNFSFACWYKLNSTTSTTWQTLFIEGRDVNSDGWGLRINGNNKRPVFYCGSSTYTYNVDLTIGTWNHLCMTINNGTYTAYVNGEQVSTGTITTLPKLTEWSTYFFVGCLSSSYYPLNGQIQDIRIYDNALSTKEVKELAKGLCLHVPLDWGANPNMIHDSYTWMAKRTGSNSGASTSYVFTKSIISDDYAPCSTVFKCSIENTTTSNVNNRGVYYSISAQGLELTDLTEGETYTYSFWAKSDSGLPSGFAAGSICESQTKISDSGFGALDSNWRKHTVTFNWTRTTKLTCCFYITAPASSTVDFQLCGIKLEKGSKATPYIPNSLEKAYTLNDYGTLFLDDCSGFYKTINKSGTPTIATNSPRGTGSYFTSGANVNCLTGFPAYAPMPNWSIVFWYKPDIGQTFTAWSDVFRFTVDTEAGTGTQFRFETRNSSGNAYSIYYNNSGSSAYGGGNIDNIITENIWYHLAFCCDGTSLYQYINGELKITHTINSNYHPTAPTGYIQFGDSGMYASFADNRVYSTCLTAQDVLQLYNTAASIDKNGNIYCNMLVEE